MKETARVRCGFCTAKVREDRLAAHLERVHPREAEAIERARGRLRELRRQGVVSAPKRSFRLPKRLPLVLAVIGLVVVLTIGVSLLPRPSTGQHIHPRLSIVINGEPATIPAGIGLSGQIVGSIHTHDSSGTIHVESREPKTLGDFFRTWGQPFAADRVLNYVVDSTHSITMTVNGQPRSAFERLVLEDNQVISIDYGPA